jgi:hypothetical protein
MGSSCTITTSYSTDADVSKAEQKLVNDLQKTSVDEMNVMGNQSSVQDGMSHIDSKSDSAFISMILYLVQESNSIAGAISVTADFMTDIADIVNLVTVSENDLSLAFEGESGTLTGKEQNEMQGVYDSINFLTNQPVTVTTMDADGHQKTQTYNGILSYLGDDSSGIWPNNKAPMSKDAVNLITTSATDIQNQFGSAWGNSAAMLNDVKTWATPVTSSSGIESYNTQYSKIMNDFQQINDQTDMQTQTVQYETQQLTTMYQQYQNLTYQIMQSLAKENMAMVQAQVR